ncbi:hypothetical protein [Niabella beijingensis]|uniref:hypothetical protein n=1 Tax=Niabella beijingensis TaxID=2872700 RepID=UPI001CBCA94E|nr:hypothetical protein [Niabella beijingensis]MBZ4190262.1 hypothetical protein [Niabella beijingensis]
MIVFFDFLFYNISKKIGLDKEGNPNSDAAFILSVLQFFNINATVLLILIFRGYGTESINKYVAGGILLTLIIFTHIRYFYIKKFDYHAIGMRWEAKSERYKSKFDAIMWIYIVISIVLFIAALIKAGSWGR